MLKTFSFSFIFVLMLSLYSCGKSGGFAPSVLPSLSGVVITPNAITVAASNTVAFSATGGSGSYSYSVFSGSGSVLSTTGSYTAPSSAGTAVVRVTDGEGQYADAIVTINSALLISPTSQSLSLNATQAFSTTGGVPPITFSKQSGVGSIDANSGLYTAPASPGSAVVRATDSYGNTSDATINVYGALGISPALLTVAVNNTINFSAGGGVAPYTYSIFSGIGSVNASSGVFTAPATAGSVTVRVTDSASPTPGTSDAVITVNNALQISPASQTLLINGTLTFSYTGGVDPIAFSIFSGGGSINSATGDYTAPGTIGTAVVRATDSYGNTSDSNVTITQTLTITPSTKILAVNNTFTFVGGGGTPPLSYSVFSGTGSINSSSGLYTAPATPGSAVVRVTDSLGATADSNVTVNGALTITPVTQTMSINGMLSFSSGGGVPPYTYSVFSGAGSINASSGAYTAPGSVGTDVVRVTDSIGNTADSTVTINNALGISPAAITLAVNNTTTFTGLAGSPGYTFSIFSGGGSINPVSGFFTAPAVSGTTVVRVTDSLSNTANSTVTINPALAISPATKTLAVNNVFTFSATGGVTPYTYSMFAGGGSVNPATGEYTAPAVAGSATVRVTDGLGNTSNAVVTINNALAISPTTSTISVANTQAYSASGGVSPYTYSVFSGTGSINPTTGLYTPAGAGVVTVRVTDSLSNSSDATLTVNTALAITPSSANVTLNSDFAFSFTGGVPPVTYSVITGTGTFADPAEGTYTAPGANASETVRVTDSLGNTSNATVNVYTSLSISPTSITLGINTTQVFTGAGGVGTLTYSMYSGNGSIDSVSGLYTAPAGAGTDVVRVTDTIGNIASANITVVSNLTISPPTLKLPVFSTTAFTSILGVPAYTYSIFAGVGSIVPSTGVYTAPSAVGSATVRVTDSAASTSDSAVTVIKPVDIKVGQYFVCALYNEGSVKCWGQNGYGQLGLGTNTSVGDGATEIGGANLFVNLGAGRTATSIAVGLDHVCALLDNATVKCWGRNTYGQLGKGDINNLGDGPNEMGDNLAAISLGTGRTATAVYAFAYISCAKLDNASVKCWGRNNYGQMGIGNIAGTNVSLGDGAGEMGDSLAALSLGTGRTATKLVGGVSHVCALLDNSTVKCWGRNDRGQLGKGNLLSLGDGASEMGDFLTAVNIDGTSGGARTATDVIAGYNHVCVSRDNATMICWGEADFGELGDGDLGDGEIGDEAGEMAAIASINMGAGFATLTNIYTSGYGACVKDNANMFKCWGYNTNGQQLLGNTTHQKTPPAAALNVGAGLVVSKFYSSYRTQCALFTNDRIKCWGRATDSGGVVASGALISTSAANIGDNAPAEVGDSLGYLNH
ncbi:MAG: hypothetical protein AABY53_08085 [Bdellovibrionota bacterium]